MRNYSFKLLVLMLSISSGCVIEYDPPVRESAYDVRINALKSAEQEHGLNHPEVAHELISLAVYYQRAEMYDKAEPLYERALAIYESTVQSDYSHIQSALTYMGRFYFMQEKYSKAESLYSRCIELEGDRYDPDIDNYEIVEYLANLGTVYQAQGRFEEAEAVFIRSLEYDIERNGSTRPSVWKSYKNLALLYSEMGREKEAAEYRDKARAASPNNRLGLPKR